MLFLLLRCKYFTGFVELYLKLCIIEEIDLKIFSLLTRILPNQTYFLKSLPMKNKNAVQNRKFLALTIATVLALPGMLLSQEAQAKIAATHIYHNHMPNFWPYYDTSTYASTSVGSPIRYTYDGQVYQLKLNPPANYTYFLANGNPMPHDDLQQYYSANAKQEAYNNWPYLTARANSESHPLSQTQVTMSAAVINNVQSFAELGLLNFKPGWADGWKSTVGSLKTTNGFNALEPIHFTGHHSMGPLVGPDYFLKDLIFQNVTLQQDYFLGDKFKSSKGFFPTELGFSIRLIPTLRKLGIEWSVVGNNHFSRTLRDYPYLDQPAYDTMVSPPNRADLQNTFEEGEWVEAGMAHEQQLIINKFPFASIPHYVQYVNPETAEVDKLAAIPVDQNASWLEGWEGYSDAISGDVDYSKYVDAAGDRVQYFVIAHDGDNSSGRAGSYDTWLASGKEYSVSGVEGMGVEEYLKAHPIPEDDIQHIQDGSWVDTRDSSSDPDWYHWHIPMGVWKGQLADFNKALGTEYELPTNFAGTPFGHAVSLEFGYHYLERNFALLQAALNYAKTAEQIWLDTHPNYWSPTTDAEKQVTYEGNQLNPYMFSYPVKGDEANDYKGGANPAELGWYFLIASIDSGFGYYDENVDDNVKPTLSFNQSLFFTEPYVQKNLAKDKTGPSMWWVQRYPTNPGSANAGKAEGWTTAYADNVFAIYTYAYDVSGISDVKIFVRPHKASRMGPTDIAPRVYDPKKFAGQPNVDVEQVGEWKEYQVSMRNLEPDMNGVAWQTAAPHLLYNVLGGKKIGNIYYAYISDYRDQLVDYYVEATDNLGNVTKSEIGHTYVGAGRYRQEGGKYVEDVNGDIEGVHMFFTDSLKVLTDKVTVYAKVSDDATSLVYADYKDSGAADWGSQSMTKVEDSNYFKTTISYTRDAGCADVRVHKSGEDKFYPSADGKCLAKGTYVIDETGSVTEGAPADIIQTSTIYFKPATTVSSVCMHFRPLPSEGDAGWTAVPGTKMTSEKDGWFSLTNTFEVDATGIEFLFNDCGNTWYKNASGGNFVVNSFEDYNVSGTTLSEGAPEGFEEEVTNKLPIANINASATQITAGQSVTLDGSVSTDPDGSIVSYKWSTGETTPKITVSPTETKSYTLTVTDDKGAVASKSITITVSSTDPEDPAEIEVVAAFSSSVSDKTVAFTNSSEVTGTADVSYLWNFGDGQTSTEREPVHTYANAGTYTVTLTVMAADKSNTTTSNVVISQEIIPLEVRLTASATSVGIGERVVLDASASTGSNITYQWNTGATTPTIEVYPEATTTYSVTVTDSTGKKATKEITITVEGVINHAPVAKLISNATDNTVKKGATVKLDASSSSDEDGDSLTYIWSTGESGLSSIEVVVNETTTYTVKVFDDHGASSEATITIKVVTAENTAPVAKIIPSSDFNVVSGNDYMLSALPSYDDNGIVKYAWYLDGKFVGNGTTFIGITNDVGSHVFELVVTDAEGLESKASVVMHVIEPQTEYILEPSISADKYLDVNEEFTISAFNSLSSLGVAKYTWDIDGEVLSKTDAVISHVFGSTGVHVITLTIEDKEGNTATDSKVVYVSAAVPDSERPTISVGGDSAYVTTDENTADNLEIVSSEPQTFSVAKLTGTIKIMVYKLAPDAAANASVQVQAEALTEGVSLCNIVNGVVDCDATNGTDYTETDTNNFTLTFAQEGSYQVQVQGKTADGSDYIGVLPLTASATGQSGDNTDSSTSSGSSGSGGSMNVITILGLGLGALFLRRKKK